MEPIAALETRGGVIRIDPIEVARVCGIGATPWARMLLAWADADCDAAPSCPQSLRGGSMLDGGRKPPEWGRPALQGQRR